ncbi:MAG: autotransporter-associated beta strand repeat-containing protein, partial [Verrucomicrobiota bacterium]
VAGVFTNRGTLALYSGSDLTNGTAVIAGAATTVVSDAGSVWSNANLTIGSAGTLSSVTISNGGQLFSGNVTVGAGGGSNNQYNVGGRGAAASVSNGTITVGNTGSGFNTLTVTNANLLTTGLVTIGNGSSNNAVNIFAGTAWTATNSTIIVGTGAAAANSLNVFSAQFTAGVISAGVNGATGAIISLNNSTGTFDSVVLNSADAQLVLSNGTLRPLASSNSYVFVDGPGSINVTSAGGFLDAAGLTNDINVGITGSGSLTAFGAGAIHLNGASTYSGTLTVSNGIVLLVNNTTGSGTGSGTVNVLTNAFLGGVGTITGAVTVNAGGTISPGDHNGIQGGLPSTLDVGTLTLAAGSTIEFQFYNTKSNDVLNVTAANGLTINGGAFLLQNLSGGTFDTPGHYELLSYINGFNGSYTNLSIADPSAGRIYVFGSDGEYIDLTILGTVGWVGRAQNMAAFNPTNNFWSLGTNWASGVAPVPFDVVTFGGNSGLVNTNDLTPNTMFASLKFLNGAGAFTLDPLGPTNGIRLWGGAEGSTQAIVNLSVNTQTINLPIQLYHYDHVGEGPIEPFSIDAANGALVLNGNISETGGSEGLVKLGAYALTLTGSNTFSGGVVISNGTLIVANLTGSGTGLGDVLVVSNTTLAMRGGVINGATGAVVTNQGVIEGYGVISNLVANQTTLFANATNLTGTGTLTVRLAGAVNVTGATIGTLSTNSVLNIVTTGGVAPLLNQGTIALAGGTLTLNYDNGTTLTNLNLITGFGTVAAALMNAAGGTVVATNGTLGLTGTVSNGGFVVIANAGTLNVAQAWVSTGTITNLGGTLGGGTLTNTGTLIGRGVLAAAVNNQNALVATNGVLTVTGVLSGAGTNFAANSGTLVLQGVNTFTGATWLNGGTVVITNDSNLGASSAVVNFNNGGTLQVLSNATLVRSITLGSAGGALDPSNQIVTIQGVISGSGALTKLGSGTLVLVSNNTYTGGTIINTGKLQIGNSTASGSLGTGTVTNNAVLIFNRTDVFTNANFITGTGWVLQNGTGTLILTNANTYSGGTVINAGTLDIRASGALGSGIVTNRANLQLGSISELAIANELMLDSGTLVVTAGAGGRSWNGGITLVGPTFMNTPGELTVNGVISGTGSLTKLGGGDVILSKANTFTGDTFIFDGTVVASNQLALQNTTVNFDAGKIQFASGITGYNFGGLAGNQNLALTNADGNAVTLAVGANGVSTVYSGILSADGALVKNGAGTLTLSGINNYSGGTTLSNGWLALGNNNALGSGSLTMAGGTLMLTGNLIVTNAIRLASAGTFDTAGHSLVVGGVIAGTKDLIKTGSGTLTFLGTNTYSGATIINQGFLVLAAGGPTNSTVTVNVNGGLIFSNNNHFVVGGLAGGGNVTLENTTGASVELTVGNNNASTVYGGVLGGSGSLIKIGTGKLELTNANTYSGATVVNAGTLAVNGNLASSTVTVNGGTLGGTGTLAGAVTVNTGGHLAPGNGVGVQSMGTLTLNSGSALDFQFQPHALGSLNDQLIVTGTDGLTINGGGFNLLTATGTNPNDNSQRFTDLGIYNLINYGGTLGGLGISALSILNPAGNRSYAFGDNGSWITLTIGGQGAGWTGGAGAPGNWTNAANWNLAVAQGSLLIFEGNTTTDTHNNFAAETWFSGIVFSNTAGAFVLNGNALALAGNVVNLSSATQTINTSLILTNGSRIFATSAGAIVVNTNISQSGGNYGIVKTGTGVLILNGNNTYAGVTEIQGGALRATDGVGLPTDSNLKLNGGVLESAGTFTRSLGTVAGAVAWAGNGGFAAYGGTLTVNIGGIGSALTWDSTPNFVQGGKTLVFGATDANGTVQWVNPLDLNGNLRTIQVDRGSAFVDVDILGSIAGSAGSGLIKTGAGTMRLSTDSSFSGALTVNAGTLLLAATLNNDGVFVNNGATVGGTGTFYSALTLASGGVLSPGEQGAGVLTASSLSLSNGFVYNWELGLTATDRVDVVTANGLEFFGTNWTLNLGAEAGVSALEQWQGMGMTNDVFVLFQVESGLVPYGLTNDVTIVGSSRWDVSQARVSVVGNQVLLSGVFFNNAIEAVPEPNVLLMWLVGIVVWVIARRRHRRAALQLHPEEASAAEIKPSIVPTALPTFSPVVPIAASPNRQLLSERSGLEPLLSKAREGFVRLGQSGVVDIDIELLQQNVWYWRRMNAGQLKTAEHVELAKQYPFDGSTVASADRVFFATYGHAPQARDWTSSYLLILRNLKRDPDFYQSVIARIPQSASVIPLRMAPGTTKLQRTVSPSGNRLGIAAMMATVVLLLVGGQVGLVLFANQTTNLTGVIFIEFCLIVGVLSVPFMANSNNISYCCPECGQEHRESEADHCEHCHLEFVQVPPPAMANFTFQTSYR